MPSYPERELTSATAARHPNTSSSPANPATSSAGPRDRKTRPPSSTNFFNRKVDVRQNGRLRKITLLEAICLRCAEDALKGNLKAAAFLLNRRQLLESSSERPANDVLDLDDRKVLESYVRQLEAKFNKQGESE
jgi:hypothetical protein